MTPIERFQENERRRLLDRIKELERSEAGLRGALDEEFRVSAGRADRIEALEVALREIAHEYTEIGRMQTIARKALGEE